MRTKGIRQVFKSLVPSALIRYRGPSRLNRVALTFDDGPVPGITDRVIKILAKRGHRGTFFVLGRNAESHPSLIDLIVQNGSEVANHSYSHTLSDGMSYTQMADEVERTDRILRRVMPGQSWFRPPRGNLSWRLFVYLRRRGGKSSPILWSLCIPHEHRKSQCEILDEVQTASPSAGDIVLLHDDHPTIVEVLPAILDLLDERGLRSVPVSELLGVARSKVPISH